MKKVLEIQGGQQLVVVVEGGEVVLRIQKAGHNRGIAKLDAAGAAQLAELLAGGEAPQPAPAPEVEGDPEQALVGEAPKAERDPAAPRCPKGKAVFVAVNPDSGNRVYRSSARDYSHAAAVKGKNDEQFSVWSFHGSAALAAKAWPGYQVQVLPVEIVEDRRQGRK